ncbi:hypothetical protein [Methanolobus profundi]|uniref:Uncharacterized protein n=1 Tax=Methanolobus profundi TaxID=487685 RepID=A0A1I4NNB3_9EURY|nr:hypothetical protein [Methanolobus profundi]SFM16855.1 hypothetical protein SAMN04488696_0160 [Methanolobus profundi]
MSSDPFRKILNNERAADALPMRMVVAVIAIGALLFLLTTGVNSLLEKEEVYVAQTIISEIEAHAEQMSSKGAGSNITLDIDVPPNTELAMGAIPNEEASWPTDARNYYIKIKDKQINGESAAYYSNATLDGCFILSPGPHTITMESVRDQNGKIFIALCDKSQ